MLTSRDSTLLKNGDFFYGDDKLVYMYNAFSSLVLMLRPKD